MIGHLRRRPDEKRFRVDLIGCVVVDRALQIRVVVVAVEDQRLVADDTAAMLYVEANVEWSVSHLGSLDGGAE